MSQLCQLAADWRGDLPADGTLFQEKIDGWRAVYLPDHAGRWGLWTRNGMPIEGTGHVLWTLAEMARAAGEPMVFDGEFQLGDSLAATKAWCEGGWRGGGEAGTFHAFDCLALAEWRAGGSDRPLVERKARLEAAFAASAGDGWDWRPGSRGRDDTAPPVRIVPDGWAWTAADVETEARRVWSAGGEGLMLKDASSPYRRNRNDTWRKVKRENMHKWMRRAA